MARLLQPPPEPLDVDAVPVVAVGTALWFLAVLVFAVFAHRLADAGELIWLWTSIAGLLLGLLGLRLCVVRRRALRSAGR